MIKSTEFITAGVWLGFVGYKRNRKVPLTQEVKELHIGIVAGRKARANGIVWSESDQECLLDALVTAKSLGDTVRR